tara:strand:+ start:5005 stop:5292 length:288 start_codon:yes stop_codon:yes gene_type:complete
VTRIVVRAIDSTADNCKAIIGLHETAWFTPNCVLAAKSTKRVVLDERRKRNSKRQTVTWIERRNGEGLGSSRKWDRELKLLSSRSVFYQIECIIP